MSTMPLPAIIARLAVAANFSEEESQKFIHEFTNLISESLTVEGRVTIKGLGTFAKVISPTGETNVEFLPERSLSEAVNAPFSMFEAIELADGLTEQMLTDEQEEQEKGNVENQTDSEFIAVDENSNDTVQTDSTETTDSTDSTDSTFATDQTEASVISENTDSRAATTAVSSERSSEETAAATEQPDEKPEITTGDATDAESREAAEERLTDEPENTSLSEKPAELGPRPEATAKSETLTDNEPLKNIAEKRPRQTPPPIRATQPPLQQSPAAKEPEPRIIEKERIVRVVKKRNNVTAIVLSALVSLLTGLIIGYFAYEWINLGEVKSVKISAEDVQVIQHSPSTAPSAADSSAMSVSEETAKASIPADSMATAAEQPAKVEKPAVPEIVTDTVTRNKYLATIARKHYGKAKFWVYIYEENKAKIADPNNVPPMTVVVVPPASKYGIKSGDPASEADAERRAREILSR